MTNTLAIWFGAILLMMIGVDVLVYGGSNALFTGKKFVDLVEWMAFWR